MRELVVFAPLVFAATACQAVDAATCGDPVCVINTLTPEQVRIALEYAGPCYQFADRYCNKIEYCTGGLTSVEDCRGWVLETVCAEPHFDSERLRGCAAWADAVACDWFWDPDFYPQEQTCVYETPRPPAPESWEDPVPPALIRPTP